MTTLSVAMALSTVQECLSQLKCPWFSGRPHPLEDLETYDRASRGLPGSIQLLWKLRLTPTASFGALIIIAHLAIAPLAQQSLLSVDVIVGRNSTGDHLYGIKSWLEEPGQIQSSNMPSWHLSPGWKGAILGGLFTESHVRINDTPLECGSNHCVYPDYQSLSICSSSANISSQLQEIKPIDGIGIGNLWRLPGGFCSRQTPPDCWKNGTDTGCIIGDNMYRANITSAVDLETKNVILQEDPAPPSGMSFTPDDMPLSRLNFTSVAFADRHLPIADFYIFYLNKSVSSTSLVDKWEAVEFIVEWCAPTFSTEMINKTATTIRHPNPCTGFIDTPYGITGVDSEKGLNMTIDRNTHYTLQRYFNATLSGTVYSPLANGNNYVESDQVRKLISFFDNGGSEANLQPYLADGQPLNMTDSLALLNQALANIGTSMSNFMSNFMRTTNTRVSEQGYNSVGATRYTTETQVHASWAWLAAPIIFSSASLFFLLVTVFLCTLNRSVAPPLWKSSTLATIRCLDPDQHQALGGAPSRKPGDDTAGQQILQLVRDGDGWLLSQVMQSETRGRKIHR